jgi:hypothetical protein
MKRRCYICTFRDLVFPNVYAVVSAVVFVSFLLPKTCCNVFCNTDWSNQSSFQTFSLFFQPFYYFYFLIVFLHICYLRNFVVSCKFQFITFKLKISILFLTIFFCIFSTKMHAVVTK